MNSVTLIMAYYENPGQLKRQYALLRSMPDVVKQNVRVIIVDDCSEKTPAHTEKIGMPLNLYRILPPKVKWNQDAARNIGAHHAITDWLLLCDMDHEIPEATWMRVVIRDLNPNAIYRFSRMSAPPPPLTELLPYKIHPNTWLLTKHQWENAGGYDERFAGYYGTDADIRDRLSDAGPIIQLDDVIIRIGREVQPDASTTQFARKSPIDDREIRRIKTERNKLPNWRPVRFRFPYEKVL